jgi:hypothetical protein
MAAMLAQSRFAADHNTVPVYPYDVIS